ncbi:MAG: helix-turn-helix transcriptional regulator [Erysipelotrichaceae bacterium]|nr:helix-turn-helix transcriptional regulator [Erysipelotrichaceae bacterium]
MERISLRSARINRSLTQKQLGAIIGVHENTIAKWEEDPTSMSIRNAEKVCKALDYNISDIFFGLNLQNVDYETNS